MKIKTYGFKGLVSPIFSLQEEFIKMGHEIIDENTEGDLCINLMFDQEYVETINYKKRYPNCKLIVNLLNYPTDNLVYTTQLKELLPYANLITTVAQIAKEDVYKNTGFDSKILYYPMKSISKLDSIRDIDFFYVGRLYSSQKRFWLVKETLNLLKYPLNELLVSGPEQPPFGIYTGFIDENKLNELYNHTKYVLCPCFYEGSMSAIEGVVAGAFPIVCKDNHWVKEFELDDFASDPIPFSIAKKIIEIENNKNYFLNKIDTLRIKYIEQMDVSNIAKRVIQFYNEI